MTSFWDFHEPFPRTQHVLDKAMANPLIKRIRSGSATSKPRAVQAAVFTMEVFEIHRGEQFGLNMKIRAMWVAHSLRFSG